MPGLRWLRPLPASGVIAVHGLLRALKGERLLSAGRLAHLCAHCQAMMQAATRGNACAGSVLFVHRPSGDAEPSGCTPAAASGTTQMLRSV